MICTSSLWPRRRIARQVSIFQWQMIELMRGAQSAQDLSVCVWSFMTGGLGHPNEYLFDSQLVSTVDAISIPGGEDEANRFLVEVIGSEDEPFEMQMARAVRECIRHQVVWLIWTNGFLWWMARVREDANLPEPFLVVDIMQPPNRLLVNQLYLFSLEGMLSGVLKKFWTGTTRRKGGLE